MSSSRSPAMRLNPTAIAISGPKIPNVSPILWKINPASGGGGVGRGKRGEGGRPVKTVRLNIAGLFTDDRDTDVSRELREMAAAAHRMGVPENIDVFQNLSFLSLPVIPALRITDSGIFDTGSGRYL